MDQSFGKAYRLLKTEEFSSVFALRRQANSAWLQVMFGQDNACGHARLGLVVGKKAAKRANRRNYMKRLLRDWFRCHKQQLPPQDIVIRVRRAFGRNEAAEIRQQLAAMLLRKKCGA